MTDTVENLILDLIEWLARKERCDRRPDPGASDYRWP
jgi:hypothetical protein